MLIVFRIGRAGNQMFQFAASQRVKKSAETVVYVGFSHLQQLLPAVSAEGRFVGLPKFLRSRFNMFDTILKILARWRLIGGVFESESREELVRNKGLLPITIFWGGWCQDENLLKLGSIIRAVEAPAVENSTSKQRNLETTTPGENRTCFVHVRRGDYATFPSHANSAALPVEWFEEQMDFIRAQHLATSFLVFSDDVSHALEKFSNMDNTKVVDLPPRDSFMLMAASDDGILSPSSFSWWAARVAWERTHGTFIAPELWAGWNAGDWVPSKRIKSKFLRYRSVRKL